MVRFLVSVVLLALIATSFAAPGERLRRHYDGGLGGFGGGGGGYGGGGYGPRQGGPGFGALQYPLGGSESFSKSSASASSSSVGGGLVG